VTLARAATALECDVQRIRYAALASVLALVPLAAPAQTWTVDDEILRGIWEAGFQESRAEAIAQHLMDVIGPRLSGSPAHEAAHDWAVALLHGWEISARKQQLGTVAHYPAWERGVTHIDLIRPRVRTLEGTVASWSPGTGGSVEGPVVVFPEYGDYAELEEWLATVKGKFVATSFPEPTCRPDVDFATYGTPGALDRLRTVRESARAAFRRREPGEFTIVQFAEAGALGVVGSDWRREIGLDRVGPSLSAIPTVVLGCEDYGLVYRLAVNNQGPVLRVHAESRHLGEMPIINTIAELQGVAQPDEVVLLSAHMDSYEGGSGATDNGAGVTVMLEALRILREAYPRPRRTIMLGLWGAEETGAYGSSRFVAEHSDLAEKVKVVLNMDGGTGRVAEIDTRGFLELGSHLARWLAQVPEELSASIRLVMPGLPFGGGDSTSFALAGAAVADLIGVSWGYDPYTWHTTRDTYDKLVLEEVRSNAVLVAMLAYLASEDPMRISRTRRILPGDQAWPTMTAAASPAGVPAVAEVLPGGSVHSDRRGPYVSGTAFVSSTAGPYHLTLCTRAGDCSPGRMARGIPAEEQSRALVLDLSNPVPSSGAVDHGRVRAAPASVQALWMNEPEQRSMHDLPVGVTVDMQRFEIRFLLNGAPHVLQFGPSAEGAFSGEGTVPGTMTRVLARRWAIRSAPASIGRLWDLQDPAHPQDRGLYRFSYQMVFRAWPY
jgi:carboxypeptidase Q